MTGCHEKGRSPSRLATHCCIIIENNLLSNTLVGYQLEKKIKTGGKSVVEVRRERERERERERKKERKRKRKRKIYLP